MAVEEPDPVTFAQERSHHHEKNEKLNLTCRHAIHLLSLEPEVLERLGGAPVQMRRVEVLAPPHGQIALSDPRCRTVARGRKLFEAALRLLEHCVCLVEPLLVEEGAAEDELGVADLIEVVDTAAQ